MIDLLQLLVQRLKQMHAALGALSQTDIETLKPTVEVTPNTIKTTFAFGASDVELQNQASLVIAQLSGLRDHFKEWLEVNGKSSDISFSVLKKPNYAAAIIFDLWNVEKHAVLRTKPKSGFVPRLVIHDRGLVVGRGNSQDSEVRFVLDTWTGDFWLEKQGDACIRLNADVLDENGNKLGDFEDLCVKAAAEWLSAMRAAGVQGV